MVGAAIPAATAAVDTTEGGCNRVLAMIGLFAKLSWRRGGRGASEARFIMGWKLEMACRSDCPGRGCSASGAGI